MTYKKLEALHYRAVKAEDYINALGQLFDYMYFATVVHLMLDLLEDYVKQKKQFKVKDIVDEISRTSGEVGFSKTVMSVKNLLSHYAEQDRLLILEAVHKEKNNHDRESFIKNVLKRFKNLLIARKTARKNRRQNVKREKRKDKREQKAIKKQEKTQEEARKRKGKAKSL